VAVGIVVLVVGTVRAGLKPARTTDATDCAPAPYLQFLFVALASSVLFAFLVAIPQYDHLATRFDLSARLEAKSIETRVMSLREGLDLFIRHPVVGTGPNAELLDVARSQPNSHSTAPLEPPHDAYLLALADVGVLGFLALAYLAVLVVRSAFRKPVRAIPVAILSVLVILALFDHYPWSLWAGQALVAAVFALVFLPDYVGKGDQPVETGPS
jgi:O-antigen ligase